MVNNKYNFLGKLIGPSFHVQFGKNGHGVPNYTGNKVKWETKSRKRIKKKQNRQIVTQ